MEAYRDFHESGDKTLEPYQVIARKILNKAADAEISVDERQIGKTADLAAGFGGSVGAWRGFVPDDPRSDTEIRAIIMQWRATHPATCKFWKELFRAIRFAIRTGQPSRANPSPIIAGFADGNLTLTPSGRSSPSEPAGSGVRGRRPDIQFRDNARGQWKLSRGWFGTF